MSDPAPLSGLITDAVWAALDEIEMGYLDRSVGVIDISGWAADDTEKALGSLGKRVVDHPDILPALVEAGLLREHYTIAWDGDPSMSGRPHRLNTGDFSSIEVARNALANLPSVYRHPERNYRIEREYRSDPDRVR